MPLQVLVRKLQESLITSDFHIKTEVLGAITYLEDQLEDQAKRWIQYTLFEVLNQEGNTPSLQVRLLCHWVLEGQPGGEEGAWWEGPGCSTGAPSGRCLGRVGVHRRATRIPAPWERREVKVGPALTRLRPPPPLSRKRARRSSSWLPCVSSCTWTKTAWT